MIDDRGNLLFEELMEKRENGVSCMAEAKGYFASDRVKEIAIRYFMTKAIFLRRLGELAL